MQFHRIDLPNDSPATSAPSSSVSTCATMTSKSNHASLSAPLGMHQNPDLVSNAKPFTPVAGEEQRCEREIQQCCDSLVVGSENFVKMLPSELRLL